MPPQNSYSHFRPFLGHEASKPHSGGCMLLTRIIALNWSRLVDHFNCHVALSVDELRLLILSFPHLTSLDLEGVTFDHQGAPTRLDGREEQYSNINRLAMTLDSDAVSVLDLFLLPSFLRARRLRYLEIKGSSRISGTMVIMHRICALSQVISSLTIISALATENLPSTS